MRRELTPRALRWLLASLFLAAAIPTVVLFHQAHSRLKWEALHQQRVLAEELAVRIDTDLRSLIVQEEERAFTDYRFLVLAGDPSANFVQRSPLSGFPVASALPGIVGYFQLDPNGELTTPIVPPPGTDATAYGITAAELGERNALDRRIRDTLQRTARSDDVAAAIADIRANAVGDKLAMDALEKDAPKQSVFDVAQEKTKNAFTTPSPPAAAPKTEMAEAKKVVDEGRSFGRLAYRRDADEEHMTRPVRKEQSAVLEPEESIVSGAASLGESVAAPVRQRIKARIFESEVEPMSFEELDDHHFVLFRNVWREGQRYVQGALIERADFLARTIYAPFRSTALATVADLAIRTEDGTLGTTAAEPLYRSRLSAPLGGLELAFTVHTLPLGPGADVILWTAILLAAVLGGGFIALYRLGARQLELGRQQQDFVAAVSHELKTPLTSIRMYGEMLREGWADETKKRSYYDFIYEESERLSRLIGNVLRLSRLTRGKNDLELASHVVGELIDNARSKVASAVERAGFALDVVHDVEAEASTVLADADAFSQIAINLVDNALKFSAKAERKVIVLATRLQSNGTVAITVRDFGPGVPPKQLRRIFELFYRGENELTRETVGTGIGLALVRELATAMHGRVDVRNVSPGVEVVVELPVRVA